MKKIIVTGGAGFVGSHLCHKLIQEGHQVYCIDNLFTGKKQNIKNLIGHDNFDFVNHDVTFPYYSLRVDEIYNLASPASPIHYQSDPIQTTKTCFLGAFNMLGLAKRTQAKILQASTSEVYGDPEQHPQIEKYFGNVNPIGIRSCYDEGKRIAESLFFDYHRIHDVKIRVARIFNTYGPNMAIDDGRVVSNFITQALKNQPITVYGSGDQTRSFLYVSDLVDGLIKLMESDHIGPFNLGYPDEFTMLELVKTVKKLTDSKSPIVFKDPLPDDPKQRRPDINQAKQLLDWRPLVDLDEGLLYTIDYFRNLNF